MGLFDEVLCNHELFGAHKGETYQTKDLHWLGGFLDLYEITPSGRLEFLEYTVEDRSDPNATGIERMFGMMTRVFTGDRRDLNITGGSIFPASAAPSSPTARWLLGSLSQIGRLSQWTLMRSIKLLIPVRRPVYSRVIQIENLGRQSGRA